MGLRITTNSPSLMAQRQMSRTQRDVSDALTELASGSRLGSSQSSAASYSLAEGLRSQGAGLQVAQRNAEDAISVVQIADGSLNEQSNILIRQRELAIQAASDTNTDTERGFINKEFSQLSEELDRIAKSTYFGSTSLLSGKSSSFDFQVGGTGGSESRIHFDNKTDTTASGLGVDGLDVSSHSDARSAIEDLDSALEKVNSARAQFGSVQSRLEIASSFLGTQVDTLAEAHSRVADTDVGDAVTRARTGQILQQYQAAALAQANQLPEIALRLIA